MWDGTQWPDEQPRDVSLVLKHPGALGRMFLPGTEVGLAEAYLQDDFDIEGTGFQTGAKPTLSCKAGVNERENV